MISWLNTQILNTIAIRIQESEQSELRQIPLISQPNDKDYSYSSLSVYFAITISQQENFTDAKFDSDSTLANINRDRDDVNESQIGIHHTKSLILTDNNTVLVVRKMACNR